MQGCGAVVVAAAEAWGENAAQSRWQPRVRRRRALRGLGFPAAIAKAAVDRARPHVKTDVALGDVIRACLRECPRPTR
jgi:hypothetical protein